MTMNSSVILSVNAFLFRSDIFIYEFNFSSDADIVRLTNARIIIIIIIICVVKFCTQKCCC